MKKVIGFIATILLIGMLAACGSSESTEGKPKEGKKKDEPVVINIGIGSSTEEPLWLLKVASDLAPNYGKKYTLEFQQFRANTDRLNAYRSESIDGGTIGQGAAIMAKAQGIDLKVVANLAKDAPDDGFNSRFMALKDSDINTTADLKGKTIGLSDFKSPTDMWARGGVRDGGLDPDKDVKWVVLPIPAMAEAIESGKIDVGMLSQPFYAMVKDSGKFKEVFTSKTGFPMEEDFFNLFLNPKFISENKEAVQALIDDLQGMTKYYLENPKEARQKLLDAKMVLTEPEVYLNYEDYKRNEDNLLNMESWEKIQEVLIKDKWIEKEIDLKSLVDDSFVK